MDFSITNIFLFLVMRETPRTPSHGAMIKACSVGPGAGPPEFHPDSGMPVN